MKWLLRAVLGTVLLAVVAYGVLLLVNLKDEELSPAAKSFAEAAKRSVPAGQNGYFAMLGLRAPEGADPHADGSERFARSAAEIRSGNLSLQEPDDRLPKPEAELLCDRRSSCLDKVRGNRAAIEFQLAKHETLRLRIRDLSRYPRFEIPRLPYHPLAALPIADIATVWALGRTESAHAWVSGRHGEAVALCSERVGVARRMLREANDTLGIILAAVWLQNEYLLLSEFLRDDPAAARTRFQAIEALLRPLADDEVRVSRWVHGEFAVALDAHRAFSALAAQRRASLGPILLGPDAYFDTDYFQKNTPRWFDAAVRLLSPFFQPNATSNHNLAQYAALATTVGGGPKAVSEMLARRPEPGRGREWSAYNPVGVALGAPAMGDYVLRLHDTDRFLRLVSIQGALVKARVPADGVEAFLASHDGAVDPVTGQRIVWDPAQSRLQLDVLDSRSAGMSNRRIGDVDGKISVVYRP